MADIEVVKYKQTISESTITISSNRAKNPKRLQFWRSYNPTVHTQWISWDCEFPQTSLVMYDSSVAERAVGATRATNQPTVTSIGRTSVTLSIPSDPDYYMGEWECSVEFE